MTTYNNNEEFFTAMKDIINAWCEQKNLVPLSYILWPYLTFSGLTDSWSELRDALRSIRAMCREKISTEELEIIEDLTRACDHVIYR